LSGKSSHNLFLFRYWAYLLKKKIFVYGSILSICSSIGSTVKTSEN
jgi:hypothetical protein